MFVTLLLALLPLVAAKSKSKSIYIDFSSYDMSNPNNTVQAILANNSLIVNNYTVDSSSDPFSRTYTAANVALDSGYLTLKVSGGTQNGSSIPSAAIQTNDTNILYGTFKTTAIASTVPGVCHGFFTYKNDCQESDIEILTSHFTTGNDRITPGLQLTNQATSCNSSQNTRDAIPYPQDPTAAAHEYTLEWSRKSTKYYFDGALIATMDTNVPYVPSAFLWNSWSSGNVNWTSGPPTEDAILRISKIDIKYTTSSAQRTVGTTLCTLVLVPLLWWVLV
ncbi:glycoside hydrolase family 16 protein [Polyporus arcularius HHB13444]|uniref:Glycoside hydrolase family 16 protein n=1 Tax=Polyporus arcularius HHB13444 TaxID=1314778 RepID=A0A5C3PM45_9APHY|nr:glycoside hydrolase family 16 protein [Polyporus arcularius HHB13444]